MDTILQCMPYISKCLPIKKKLRIRQRVFFYMNMIKMLRSLKDNEDHINDYKQTRDRNLDDQDILSEENSNKEPISYLNNCPCKMCIIRRALEAFF